MRGGSAKVGDTLTDVRLDGTTKDFKIMKLYTFQGLRRVETEKVECGDICAIAGCEDCNVGETFCAQGHPNPLPKLRVDEPTLQMEFGTNSSPLRGQEGKFVTARVIEDRLYQEVQRDVSLRYSRIPNTESWTVSGRGELHLGVLIETLRREGYELEVSKPHVIVREIDGVKCEPYEDLQIDVPTEFVGDIMETLGTRGASMIDMVEGNGQTRLTYVIPSRGLLGFVNNFLTLTKGYGIINHTFKEYRPVYTHSVGERPIGVLVSTDKGPATPYSIEKIEDHGTMFITPGTVCYEGMIVGEHRYPNDLAVNVTAVKPQTNVRSSNKDQTVVLKSPRRMTLEACLDYINSDELVEVTPSTFRMRKKILSTPNARNGKPSKRRLKKLKANNEIRGPFTDLFPYP